MSVLEGRRVSARWVFRDTEYQVTYYISDDVLEVMVEETISTNQWKGRFEAKHIEELTRKTGNFKQFLVFATMLESAINKSSECVTLDLLTYADLEVLRERKNGTTAKRLCKPAAPTAKQQQPQTKRYLILTYSVEFDRIHYPLALPFTGQADSAQMKDTIRRLATELDKYKRQNQGKRHTALARLQKDYDALLREKGTLEEELEAMQEQLLSAGEVNDGKQLKILQKVIKNLEEEVLHEKNKHQRYVNKKTEEMRALMQELGELRSSERTLRSRVKNLTNELSVLKKGLRSSPSAVLRPRQSPSFKKTSSSTGGSVGMRRRSNSGSLERRQRSSSHDRRPATGFPGRSRLRTPSPRGGRQFRFDPSAYVEDKRRQQKEIKERFQRLRSPSYHDRGTHSRSSSVEKAGSGVARPSVQRSRSGSRRLWGSTPENLKGTRTRSSSLGSLSGHSSKGSSAASSRTSSRRPSLTNLSDIEPSPAASASNKRQGRTGSSQKHYSSSPTSAKGSNKNNGSLLDHSREMSEIDARLNALQQFMKRSLETKSQSKR